MVQVPTSAELVTVGHQMSFIDYLFVRLRQLGYSGKTNAPFISSDSLATLADYYPFGISGLDVIDTDALEGARVIFVNSDRLVFLLETYSHLISAKVLISGNGDQNWEEAPDLPASIVMWFAQNSGIDSPRVQTLPIGIENLRLGRRGIVRYYRPHTKARIEDKVFVPPMSDTNPVRAGIVEEALAKPQIFRVNTSYLRSSEYFRVAKTFRFVLCLEGNGSDTHRVWETLYFGNFPVLLSTPWSRSLARLELPLLIVDSLSELTEKLLLDFVSQNKGFDPRMTEQLWLPYWESMFKQYSA